MTARADRPLLQLAGHLSRRGSFAPTPIEQARLRRRFDQLKQDRRVSTMQRPFLRILKPTLQAALWAVLLLGVFAVTAVLLTNLLGKPANTPAGPAPVLPGAATIVPTAALSERAAITPTALEGSPTAQVDTDLPDPFDRFGHNSKVAGRNSFAERSRHAVSGSAAAAPPADGPVPPPARDADGRRSKSAGRSIRHRRPGEKSRRGGWKCIIIRLRTTPT